MNHEEAILTSRFQYRSEQKGPHPVVMGAMNEFLRWLAEPATAELYEDSNRRCAEWGRSTNRKLVEASLPLRVVNLATVWTVLFKEPGRYNWLLQYYLRSGGITLSWVGTGRCLSSMDFTADDYRALEEKLLHAAREMKEDGWWLTAEQYPGREKSMRAGLIREVLGSLVQWPKPLRSFYSEVMRRKEDDHHGLLSIWGFFLVMRFPHDDWYMLPALETAYYALAAYLER